MLYFNTNNGGLWPYFWSGGGEIGQETITGSDGVQYVVYHCVLCVRARVRVCVGVYEKRRMFAAENGEKFVEKLPALIQ